MEPSQRSSCSTLSTVTSWTTSRNLYRYTKDLTALLTDTPLQVSVSKFFFWFQAQRKIYSACKQKNALPYVSTWQLIYQTAMIFMKMYNSNLWHPMLAWFLYQPYLLLCYSRHSIKEAMGVFNKKQLHLVACVNKWSPLYPKSCFCDYSLSPAETCAQKNPN